MKTLIKDIPKITTPGRSTPIVVKGWIFNKRSSGGIHFLQLRDGSGFIQAVVEKQKVGDKSFTKCDKLTIESSVEIKGKVREDKRSPFGFEISVESIKIIQKSEEFPIQKNDHSIEFLLDRRHLWLRSKREWTILKIRNTIINSIYEYLNQEGFIKIDSPVLTPNACEGTTTLFEVPYTPAWEEGAKTGPKAYLSQSGQLYLEAAIFAFGKVFDFGPVFRAEKSKTRRHLTEFWMMNAEVAFADHKENMKIQQKLCQAIIQKVLNENQSELEILERDTSKLEKAISGDFPIISHKQAIQMLQNAGYKIREMENLGADTETYLASTFDKPFFVEKYPKAVKAFYMKEDPTDSSRVLDNDMLAPEGYGEINGGSEREDNYEKLLARIKENHLSIKDFGWYLDLRKYGSVPHSGFGIGLERYVRWICGLKHIREAIPFPRTINRLTP